MKKEFSAVIVMGGIALLLAACAPAAAPPAAKEAAPAPAAKEKPRYGGGDRFTISNPRIGQDPKRGTGSAFIGTYSQAYSALLRYKFIGVQDTDLIVAPDLVERWENPDPKTWIFHVRRGVKWHNLPPVNGREFVADDVVFGINYLRSEGSAQKGYWLDLDSIEALDRYTVKLTLKNPVAPFLTLVAFGFNKMVAKEAVEAGKGSVEKGPLIGTGAWFVTCIEDQECKYKRNPDFYLKDDDGNQLPYLDERLGLVILDVQAVFAAFRAKQLDTHGPTTEEVGILQRAYPELLFRQAKSFGASLVHFRNDQPPFNDERVRTAVSKAIDRQQIIDTFQGGKAWFQLGWGAPGDDWYLPQEEYQQAYKRDVPLAKKLMAEAGYPNGVEIPFWCAQYGVNDVPMCELIQAQVAEAGIRAKIYVHDRPTYLTKVYIRDGTFEGMSGFAQGVHAEPDLWLSDYYHSQGGRNSGHIRDPELDKMIEAQRRELDPEKRRRIVLEIQRYLLQKNYGLALYSAFSNGAWWPWLKNRSFVSDYAGGRSVDYLWVDQALADKLGRPKK